MDPYIFADQDSGSQNLADPTDPDPVPDPKHWTVDTRGLRTFKVILEFLLWNKTSGIYIPLDLRRMSGL